VSRFAIGLPDTQALDNTYNVSKRSASWGLRCSTSLVSFIDKKSCTVFLAFTSASEKRERLVDWNLLLNLLQKVVSRRAAVRERPFDATFRSKTGDAMTPWEERAETIEIPRFCKRIVDCPTAYGSTEVSHTVREQLRSYVETVACHYEEHFFTTLSMPATWRCRQANS
jgi:hypothetical protein